MKVLFAVSNEEISKSIVKNYQRVYKDIISYKNVYYFNALIKEIKKDKSYDRIVISEDLEPSSGNNYDNMDNALFEKLDTISDEANDDVGNETEIVLICTDRRTISDNMLSRIFGIGIYNALVGGDRSIENVCSLINKPRTKKEAKIYYKIDAEDVNYASTEENTVSEIEIQNIKAHFARLEKGNKDHKVFVESFDNIASQYNTAQLKLIVKFLPLGTKVILEQNSSEYQKVTMYDTSASAAMNSIKEKKYAGRTVAKPDSKEKKGANANTGINILDRANTPTFTKPVVIPGANSAGVRKIQTPKPAIQDIDDYFDEEEIEEVDLGATISRPREEPVVEAPKKGRGRPKKVEPVVELEDVQPIVVQAPVAEATKKGRGRPKKIEPVAELEDIQPVQNAAPVAATNLYDLGNDEDEYEEDYSNAVEDFEDISVPMQKQGVNLFDLDAEPEEPVKRPAVQQSVNTPSTVLPGFDDEEEEEEYEEENYSAYEIPESQMSNNRRPFAGGSIQPVAMEEQVPYNVQNGQLNYLLTGDKKIVTFVGTTKNGCSFLVNNLAKLFSDMQIKTAILDMTQSKNSYYIYTKNQEELRQQAYSSMDKLEKGIDDGIRVNANLTVFTNLPGKNDTPEDAQKVLSTLAKNYSLVLIDADFNTDLSYFSLASEIYLVQSLDILTIQPFTAFLRELKTRGILKDNIRIVINKFVKCKGLSTKSIIGGLAFYNDPAMTFMHELFDRNAVKDYTIPFVAENYAKYIESLVSCNISLNGYSKDFLKSLKELADGVYPLIGGNGKRKMQQEFNNQFSPNMSGTLDQMKNKY